MGSDDEPSGDAFRAFQDLIEKEGAEDPFLAELSAFDHHNVGEVQNSAKSTNDQGTVGSSQTAPYGALKSMLNEIRTRRQELTAENSPPKMEIPGGKPKPNIHPLPVSAVPSPKLPPVTTQRKNPPRLDPFAIQLNPKIERPSNHEESPNNQIQNHLNAENVFKPSQSPSSTTKFWLHKRLSGANLPINEISPEEIGETPPDYAFKFHETSPVMGVPQQSPIIENPVTNQARNFGFSAPSQTPQALFPAEMPNSYQKSLFKQQLGGKSMFINNSPGINVNQSNSNWATASQTLLQERAVQHVARNNSSTPPPPKQPPFVLPKSNIHPNEIKIPSSVKQLSALQSARERLNQTLHEQTRLGLTQPLPPGPKMPPNSPNQNRDVPTARNRISLPSMPNTTDTLNSFIDLDVLAGGNGEGSSLHQINWFTPVPEISSKPSIHGVSLTAESPQKRTAPQGPLSAEQRATIESQLTKIHTTDPLRDLIFKTLQDGQPHAEGELHKLIKQKKNCIGAVTFGMLMYSLVEQFGSDAISISEKDDGRYFQISADLAEIVGKIQ
jgi:hypothetical protein